MHGVTCVHLMHVRVFMQPNFVVLSENILLHISAIRKAAGEHVQMGHFGETYPQDRQDYLLDFFDPSISAGKT